MEMGILVFMKPVKAIWSSTRRFNRCTMYDLAGIPQSPATYELTSAENVQKAKARQKLVLEAMMDKKIFKSAPSG